MSMTVLTLKFLWDFIQPLLTDAAKERLKPKGSAETAKERAFALYGALRYVDGCSDKWVATLNECAETALKISAAGRRTRGGLSERWYSIKSQLQDKAHEMSEALAGLERALLNVNPQMEIHNGRLVETVTVYHGTRAGVVEHVVSLLEKQAGDVSFTDAQTLKQLATESEANHQRVKQAISELRSFLAATFTFKESF